MCNELDLVVEFRYLHKVFLEQTLGRGIPIARRSVNDVHYQATHVGYDWQDESSYEEQPIKMQRTDDDYQALHVGYDLNGEPLYETQRGYGERHPQLMVKVSDIRRD